MKKSENENYSFVDVVRERIRMPYNDKHSKEKEGLNNCFYISFSSRFVQKYLEQSNKREGERERVKGWEL
jgi:hypothetical protein